MTSPTPPWVFGPNVHKSISYVESLKLKFQHGCNFNCGGFRLDDEQTFLAIFVVEVFHSKFQSSRNLIGPKNIYTHNAGQVSIDNTKQPQKSNQSLFYLLFNWKFYKLPINPCNIPCGGFSLDLNRPNNISSKIILANFQITAWQHWTFFLNIQSISQSQPPIGERKILQLESTK